MVSEFILETDKVYKFPDPEKDVDIICTNCQAKLGSYNRESGGILTDGKLKTQSVPRPIPLHYFASEFTVWCECGYPYSILQRTTIRHRRDDL